MFTNATSTNISLKYSTPISASTIPALWIPFPHPYNPLQTPHSTGTQSPPFHPFMPFVNFNYLLK